MQPHTITDPVHAWVTQSPIVPTPRLCCFSRPTWSRRICNSLFLSCPPIKLTTSLALPNAHIGDEFHVLPSLINRQLKAFNLVLSSLISLSKYQLYSVRRDERAPLLLKVPPPLNPIFRNSTGDVSDHSLLVANETRPGRPDFSCRVSSCVL